MPRVPGQKGLEARGPRGLGGRGVSHEKVAQSRRARSAALPPPGSGSLRGSGRPPPAPAPAGVPPARTHSLLTLHVQGTGGFIQDEHAGVPHEGPGDGQTLLLPHRQLAAFLPHLCGDRENALSSETARTTPASQARLALPQAPRRRTSARGRGRRGDLRGGRFSGNRPPRGREASAQRAGAGGGAVAAVPVSSPSASSRMNSSARAARAAASTFSSLQPSRP